jgi:hypothetical protein
MSKSAPLFTAVGLQFGKRWNNYLALEHGGEYAS